MNFIKKIIGFGAKSGQDIDQITKELWSEFEETEITGSVYRYDRKTHKKEVLSKRTKISFDYDTERDFEYFIYIQKKEENQSQKKSQKQEDVEDDQGYFLPINVEKEFKYFISKRETQELAFDYINIEFFLDENSTIRIMINITHEADKVEATLFIDELSKLLYQNKYQKSYKLAKNQEEYANLIQLIEKGTMQTGSEISSISSYQEYQDQSSKFSSEASINQQKNDDQMRKSNYPDLKDIDQQMQKLSLNEQNKKQQQKQEQFQNQEQKLAQNRNPEEIQGKTQVKLDEDKLQKVLLHEIQKDDVTCAYTGKYCLIDKSVNQPVLVDYVVFTISKGDQEFQYRMNIYNQDNKRIYAQNVDKELNFRIDIQDNFIKWVYYNEQQNYGEVLCILFDKPGQALTLSFQFNQALYEIKNQSSLENTLKKQEDHEFMSNYMKNEDDLNRNDKFQEEIVQQYDDGLNYQSQSQPTFYGQKDNYLTEGKVAMDQGRICDRTFVSKQGIIGIYKTDTENQCNLKYDMNMPELTDLQGNKLDPVKLQMMQQDEKMIIVNNYNDKSCYQLDLVKGGKIVRELKIDGFNTISDISMEKKHQELTQDQVFNACNSKNLFKLDPRIKDAKVAEIVKEHKHYASNNGFTCLTTNKAGNVAVGSENGDIRLYNGIGKQAKNKYPGFGDPISHIETTKDGKWVLATCKNYLILLPTFGKGAEQQQQDSTGYTKQMKYEDRKLPRKLKILPDDQVRYNIRKVEFSAARFDEKENGKEQFIVAGTGKYCVVWSFSSILRGDLFDYRIAPYNDNIEDIQFKFNSEQYIFAAMNKNIQLGLTQKQKYGKK